MSKFIVFFHLSYRKMYIRSKFYVFSVFVCFIMLFPFHGMGSQLKRQYFTLDDVIRMARETSPDALVARHRFRGSYWQHRSFQAGYLPNLRFDATIPNLNRTISPITLPDGSDIFIQTKSGHIFRKPFP
jgi:hypothetical protein